MLTGRTGAQAIPRADIWETSRDFPALDGSRQDPGWCCGALGTGGAGESWRLPVLSSPWLAPTPLPGAGGGCSARGQCPLSRIEKVTGNVTHPGGAGFSGAFPTEPSGSFDGEPQALDAGEGNAWWGNDLCFHVFHVLALLF